jgi:hypothetical protein
MVLKNISKKKQKRSISIIEGVDKIVPEYEKFDMDELIDTNENVN